MRRQRAPAAGSRASSPAPPARPARGAALATLVLLAAVATVVVIRVRLLGMPLERDEGEFASMGQLMLQGVPPWAAAYNLKFPGTYAAYAAVMGLFGQSPAGIHLGLTLVTLATSGLVYLLARRLFTPSVAAVAGASHAVLAVGTSVLGLAAHPTHFVVLFAVGGPLVLVRAVDRPRGLPFLWAGMLLGAACVMKQPGALLTLFGGLYVLWVSVRDGSTGAGPALRRTGLYALGATIPFGLVCLVLVVAGVFDRFWIWTVRCGAEYASRVTLAEGMGRLGEQWPAAVGPFAGLWGLAGLGLLAVVGARALRGRAAFVVGWAVFSAAAGSTTSRSGSPTCGRRGRPG